MQIQWASLKPCPKNLLQGELYSASVLEFASFLIKLISDKNNIAQDPEIHLRVFWFILFSFYFVL